MVGLSANCGAIDFDGDGADVEQGSAVDMRYRVGEALTTAVFGSTNSATLTTTVPRSKGPAVAGVITARDSGAPW